MSDDNKDACRLLTPQFRVSFPHVFKPSVMKGTNNPPKYSVTMLFPKDSNIKPLQEVIKQAKIAKFGPNKNDWPEGIASPVDDGDDPKHAKKEGYAGHWVLKASTGADQRPGVFDEKVQEIVDPSRFYPGCYAKAYVYAYVWEFPKGSGRFGVSFILDHVQKVADGKSFSSKKAGTEIFAPVAGGNNDSDEVDDDEDVDFK